MLPSASPVFAYIGCRTTRERNASGTGITVCHFDNTKGNLCKIQYIDGLVNPSYLITDPIRASLYVVHGDMSTVSSFRIDSKTGAIRFLNQRDTRGLNPVHLALDQDGQRLTIANYATGSVASLPLEDDGALGEIDTLIPLPGTPGPNRFEQKGSHPHEIKLDPIHRFMVVPDKGLDRIFAIALDEAGRPRQETMLSTVTRKGAGPRHVAFNRDSTFCYVVNELDSSVIAYTWHPHTTGLTPFQILPTIPEDFTGDNTASEIVLSACGRFLYVSNRGHDSLCQFLVAPGTGRLSNPRWTSSLGRGPRFFSVAPSGRWLIAANEASNTIVTFLVDAMSGELSPHGPALAFGSPTCISWFIPADCVAPKGNFHSALG